MSHKSMWSFILALAILANDPARAQSTPDSDETPANSDASFGVKLDDSVTMAVNGINAFSLGLYRQTLQQDENHFISPASVSMAMSLAYRGTGGTTAKQMREVLHYTAQPADYLRSVAKVLESINFAKAGRQLATANAIWIDRSISLQPDYLADTSRLAGSAVQQVDFRTSAAVARGAINRWVADKTNNKIKDLLSAGAIKADTRFILVNTIYWKADWQLPFQTRDTRQEPFMQSDGREITTTLMHQNGRFFGLEQDGVKAILLPYTGQELEMVVFLPNSPKGLPRFEAGLTAATLTDWFVKLKRAGIKSTTLTLPKMRLRWSADLVPKFKVFGLTTPFTNQADFSGMAVMPKDQGLMIGQIVHQTYLDVDEKGSEAAGATAVVGLRSGSARPTPAPSFVFRADHPFFFVLRDRRTGLICFMGRFVKPESAQ